MRNEYYTIRLYPSLSVGGHESYLLQYSATLTQATRVVEWYDKLWRETIEKQLEHLDPDFERVGVDALTDDVVVQNWEGSEVLAFSRFSSKVLYCNGLYEWEDHDTQRNWVEVGDGKFIPKGTPLEDLL
tara:strand:+ start:275 stop:661 length:387 start_codon:yes stop_codon:yes gene_type:complete